MPVKDTSGRGRLLVACSITSFIVIAEFVGALITGSLALLVDSALYAFTTSMLPDM